MRRCRVLIAAILCMVLPVQALAALLDVHACPMQAPAAHAQAHHYKAELAARAVADHDGADLAACCDDCPCTAGLMCSGGSCGSATPTMVVAALIAMPDAVAAGTRNGRPPDRLHRRPPDPDWRPPANHS